MTDFDTLNFHVGCFTFNSNRFYHNLEFQIENWAEFDNNRRFHEEFDVNGDFSEKFIESEPKSHWVIWQKKKQLHEILE